MKVLALLFLFIAVALSAAPVACPKGEYDHATWPYGLALNIALGECLPGYSSDFHPARFCHSNGVYSNKPYHRCLTNYCPEDTVDGVFFARTKNRDTANGVCPEGTDGNPTRFCNIDGEWGEVNGECSGDNSD